MTPTLSTPELLRAVNAVPEGQTARQIAERFPNSTLSRVSSRLSMAALYGWIDRDWHQGIRTDGGMGKWCVYRAKN